MENFLNQDLSWLNNSLISSKYQIIAFLYIVFLIIVAAANFLAIFASFFISVLLKLKK